MTFTPVSAGKPMAPTLVVITGQDIENASSSFTRCPVPENSGAITMVFAPSYKLLVSGTCPANSTFGAACARSRIGEPAIQNFTSGNLGAISLIRNRAASTFGEWKKFPMNTTEGERWTCSVDGQYSSASIPIGIARMLASGAYELRYAASSAVIVITRLNFLT